MFDTIGIVKKKKHGSEIIGSTGEPINTILLNVHVVK